LPSTLDNRLSRGNPLTTTPSSISGRRVRDVEDRVLRDIVVGLGPPANGLPRQTGFEITAASELMAALAMATSLRDLRERMGRVVVGYTAGEQEPVTAEQLDAAGVMTVLLRDALKPNLLQTLENTPALVHC